MYVERRSRVPGATVWRTRQHPPTSVLPDGCMDLLWLESRLVIAGPDTRAEPAGGGSDVTGVRFDPGVAPGLLGVAASDLRDARVPLDRLWSPVVVARWTDRLHRGDPADTLERLAGALTEERGGDIAELSAIAGLAARGRPVGEICSVIGWSERTLHRRCLEAFGYGSKTLARVLRFQRAARALWAGQSPADVAMAVGYADQAHLTREVSALAGVTPRQLAVTGTAV